VDIEREHIDVGLEPGVKSFKRVGELFVRRTAMSDDEHLAQV
jgi:hypothetical protein